MKYKCVIEDKYEKPTGVYFESDQLLTAVRFATKKLTGDRQLHTAIITECSERIATVFNFQNEICLMALREKCPTT